MLSQQGHALVRSSRYRCFLNKPSFMTPNGRQVRAVATFYLVTKLRYDRYLTPLDWGGAVGGTYVGTSPVILFFCSVSIHTFLIAT